MGNEQGSILSRQPLQPPCKISWEITKCEGAEGKEGHTATAVDKKVIYQYL